VGGSSGLKRINRCVGAQPGIYAPAPTARVWRLVAPEWASQTILILGFSCDTHGHVKAIWGHDLSVMGVAQPTVVVHGL